MGNGRILRVVLTSIYCLSIGYTGTISNRDRALAQVLAPTEDTMEVAPKEATRFTKERHAAAIEKLPFDDRQDFADAERGLIGSRDEAISNASGRPVWSLEPYKFLESDSAPATVHPSLWRQARLNMRHGLYRIADRIYQLRGMDLSNMDVIEGDTGLIVIDPLISAECAKAALELYFQHRPKKPVLAVIYTHSHVDHFGGVKGVISEEDARAGKVRVIAPEGFLEHAVSENVMAGNAMLRRASYMYGPLLARGERGQVDAGLGKNVSTGTVTLIPPNDTITKTGETRTIDGVEIVFQMAPETEAPSEMLMYFPQFRALCVAEVATHNLHNLYTLRGAEVRSPHAWWKALNEAIDLFGDKSDVVFAQHHWPRWGGDRVVEFLKGQRDVYKYLQDQSLRLMNQGYTMSEVAEMIELPASLARHWDVRGYYGSVNHNAKAVYQKYLGWYDSNPAHLNPLPPVEAAKKYVDFMGGADAVLARARESFDKGEYRWVAEVMNHVVFADPENRQARELEADALEQLGYQTENATWRNEYLVGAYELRNGLPKTGARPFSVDMVKAMTLDMFFDFMGVRLNGPKAAGVTLAINFNFTDTGEKYAVTLENSTLIYAAGKQLPKADAVVTLKRATLNAVAAQETTFPEQIAAGAIKIDGSPLKLMQLFSLLDTFAPTFNIVTP
jgi:linear primary-alkylsulfatase